MKPYKVVLHEVVATTYRVEAVDEDDAFDAVRSGEGREISKEAFDLDEFNVPEDSAEEIREEAQHGVP